MSKRHFGRFWFGLAMVTGILLALDVADQPSPTTLSDMATILLGTGLVFAFLFISTWEEW